MTIETVFERTDWSLLAHQKLALIEVDRPWAEGLLGFIDAIQDAAEKAGYPVVWLNGDDK